GGGTHFRSITRQVLFDDNGPSGTQLRYFEIAPGGHSTLERHEHVHSVMILRGRGQALVGNEIHTLGVNDLVHVPPQTWHQFRATADEPLGFLCLVLSERDKPQHPTPAELAALKADGRIGPFVRA
ncbi:MAG TPA: cupin domain-containing protein, partial [Opitutaceae bacterium]|nr:cupin domain-containing protein [Opitutaceae bacterium]